MTPRIDMICAPHDASPQQVGELVLASGHTRIPVYRGSVDEIVGILHVRDLLRPLLRAGRRALAELLQPPHFVPESKSLVLAAARAAGAPPGGGHRGGRVRRHPGHGDDRGPAGGDIRGDLGRRPPRSTPAPCSSPTGAGGWRPRPRRGPGRLLGVELEAGEWETVGGLTFALLGHVPKVGEAVEMRGLRFVVESADRRTGASGARRANSRRGERARGWLSRDPPAGSARAPWRSWGGPTPASRRCSTGCSARSWRSSRASRRRPARGSSASSPSPAARSSSTTRRACTSRCTA